MPAAPPTWTFSLARATAFSVVSAGLGTAAHLVAGGCLSGPATAGGLSLAFVAGLFLSRRERTLGSILPALTAVQVALHLYFAYSCAAGVGPVTDTVTDTVTGSVTGTVTGTIAHLHHHTCCELLPGIDMIMLHGWAVVLTALWLAGGEAAVWALVRRVGDRLTGLVFGRPAHGVAPLCAVRPTEPGVLRPAVLRHVVHLRGPPRSGLAALG